MWAAGCLSASIQAVHASLYSCFNSDISCCGRALSPATITITTPFGFSCDRFGVEFGLNYDSFGVKFRLNCDVEAHVDRSGLGYPVEISSELGHVNELVTPVK